MTPLTLERLFEAARASFKDDPRLHWAEDVTPFDDRKRDVEGLTATAGESLLIVFRGTDSRANWVTNLTFPKRVVPYNGVNPRIRVHGGWLAAYKPVVREIIHAAVAASGARRVVVVGYSMGGALAILSAVDIQYNFPGVSVQCATFGAPRVGNRAFRRSYNRRLPDTVRVVNGGDIVTKLPPWAFGFYHVGNLEHVGDRRGWRLSVRDHLPAEYVAGLVEH